MMYYTNLKQTVGFMVFTRGSINMYIDAIAAAWL